MTALQIDLRAKNVMTADPICVQPATSFRELARVLEENQISGAPVVDQQGSVIGIVTKSDLIRRCVEGTADIPPAYLFEMLSEQEEDGDPELAAEPDVHVEDLMTEDPIVVAPETPVDVVARTMYEKRIHRVVVVGKDAAPLGIITSMDLIGALSQRESERRKN